MTISSMAEISYKFVGKPNALNSVLGPDEIKAKLDLGPEEVRVSLNSLIDELILMDLIHVPHSDDVKAIRINVDNVIEVTLDGETWEATGSSGHLILDKLGNILPQRSRMKFMGATTITDDGTNTIINGVQGIQGVIGPIGIQGIQGIQGIVGKSIIPSVNQTTGLMSFTEGPGGAIPASVYVKGPQGPQGVQGLQGSIGSVGGQGIQGTKGDNGSQGPSGVQGAQGTLGSQGDSGERGQSGVQGPLGPQGLEGDAGVNGTSFVVLGIYNNLLALQTAHAVGNAGDAYAVGSTSNNVIYNWDITTSGWINLGSLQGPTGPQGIQGVQGNNGSTGTTGDTGAVGGTGIQGIQGVQGIQGDVGNTGSTGLQGGVGNTGAQGTTGAQGIQGVDGPNTVTTSTTTGIVGLIKGDGAVISQAVAGTDYIAMDEFNAHLAEDASETVKGHVELATSAETTAGTDNTRAVHPAGLKFATDLLVPLTKSTWEKIADKTISSPIARVDFASIPSGYKQFKITFVARDSAAPTYNISLMFNDDAGANYRNQKIICNATVITTNAVVAQNNIDLTGALPGSSYEFSYGNIYVSNYDPLNAKAINGEWYTEKGTTANTLWKYIIGGLWTNFTDEINKISLVTSSSYIGIRSKFTLWGCK